MKILFLTGAGLAILIAFASVINGLIFESIAWAGIAAMAGFASSLFKDDEEVIDE